jgi:uncharacterized damage-inducible protein DinB
MPHSPMVGRFRHWFEQECDAIDRTIASLGAIPESGRESEEYRKALSILAHVIVARGVWLDRFRGTAPAGLTMFPADKNIEQIAADWITTRNAWQSYLEGLSDEGLAEDFAYHSSDGGHWHNSIEDTLVQLFTHSAYHRGQIAMLVKLAGGEPPVTDYIYWCRRPVE